MKIDVFITDVLVLPLEDVKETDTLSLLRDRCRSKLFGLPDFWFVKEGTPFKDDTLSVTKLGLLDGAGLSIERKIKQ